MNLPGGVFWNNFVATTLTAQRQYCKMQVHNYKKSLAMTFFFRKASKVENLSQQNVSDLKLPSRASAAQTSQASRHSGAASPKCLESCLRRQLRLWPHHSGKCWRCLSSEVNEISCVYMQYFVYFSLSLSLSLQRQRVYPMWKSMMDYLFFWGGEGGWEVRGEEHLGLVI